MSEFGNIREGGSVSESFRLVLEECVKSAKEGYQTATKEVNDLKNSLAASRNDINRVLEEIEKSSYNAKQQANDLEVQLRDFDSSILNLTSDTLNSLNDLNNRVSNFSITLFGRTMAGKSTLMEVLTEGDGRSIGKGSQRTTLDTRSYIWNGLKITDVPGIAAFEGEVDEKVAFENAKTADLILFLITDDAPQASEADRLSKIKKMGKPVICIMNVKASVSVDDDLEDIRDDLEDSFEESRLQAIQRQFLSYAPSFGQNWDKIPFCPVHLKLAFVAQNTADPDLAKAFQELSRIDSLKNLIIDQVKKRGVFIRALNFNDIVSTKILREYNSLLDKSYRTANSAAYLRDKKKSVKEEADEFYSDGCATIKNFVSSIVNEIYSYVSPFAEQNYDNENAESAWAALIKSLNIEKRCNDCLKDLADEMFHMLEEIAKDISRNLSLDFRGRNSIVSKQSLDMSSISANLNTSSVVTAGVAGGALGLALGGLKFGLVGLVAGGILGYLFDNKEEKKRKAIKELEDQLNENVPKIGESLSNSLNKAFKSFFNENMNAMYNGMDMISKRLDELSSIQRSTSDRLNNHLLEMNTKIVEKAFLCATDKKVDIFDSVGRVPGQKAFIFVKDNCLIRFSTLNAVTEQLSEEISISYKGDSVQENVRMVFEGDISLSDITVNSKTRSLKIKVKDKSPETKNRLEIVQQLTKMKASSL